MLRTSLSMLCDSHNFWMPVAVFVTYCGGSLPATAEPLPASTRPFKPQLCCGTSFVSGRCPSNVNVRVFHSTSFISALLWRLLAGTEDWIDSERSVRKMEPARIRSRDGSPGNHIAFINLNAIHEAKSVVSVFTMA